MKINKTFLLKITAAIIFLENRPPDYEGGMINWIFQQRRLGIGNAGSESPLRTPFREMIMGGKDVSLEQFKEELEGLNLGLQVVQEDEPLSLIERIIGIITRPFAGSGKGFVQSLRKAILSRAEREELLARMEERELYCRCGHRFQPGELATFAEEGYQSDVGLLCSSCAMPHSRKCSHEGCDTLLPLNMAPSKSCGKHGDEKIAPRTNASRVKYSEEQQADARRHLDVIRDAAAPRGLLEEAEARMQARLAEAQRIVEDVPAMLGRIEQNAEGQWIANLRGGGAHAAANNPPADPWDGPDLGGEL